MESSNATLIVPFQIETRVSGSRTLEALIDQSHGIINTKGSRFLMLVVENLLS